MMNKIITIAAFALAISMFIFENTNDIWVSIFSFFLIYLIIDGLFWLEKKLKSSEDEFVNRMIYYLTKNDEKYCIQSTKSCYEYIKIDEMKYSKLVCLKSCDNALYNYQERYLWSSFSKQMQILPYCSGQKIKRLPSYEMYDIAQVDFNKSIGRGKTIDTGFKLIGLKDPDKRAKPVLSIECDKKILTLDMSVKIPEELNPQNAKFIIVQTNNKRNVIKSEDLEYNDTEKGYTKTIKYPRRGWTYIITWTW